MTVQASKHSNVRLLQGVLLTSLVAAFAYIFFEWLFIVTSPSFMNALGFLKNLEILIVAVFALYAILALALIPIVILGLVPRLQRYSKIWIVAGTLLPAVLLGLLSLLLADNFTYTVFRFGIVTSTGLMRAIYAVVFVAAVVLWWRFLARTVTRMNWKWLRQPLQKAILPVLVLAVLVPTPVIASTLLKHREGYYAGVTASGNLPNILFITSDGLYANSMSVYGYERDTTPFLREMAKDSLVAENNFTNVGGTTGSMVSIYTGKSPFKTRVIYPPDVLKGSDSYQHLPGLLRAMGYKTVQLSIAHYADARSQNLLEGFDEINGEAADTFGGIASLNRVFPTDISSFINKVYQRATERLNHIFFIKVMENPYLEVVKPPEEVTESRKLTASLKLLNKTTQPVFIHIHLMGTHGPRFGAAKRIFSVGQEVQSQEPWNVDFYDDSILSFDQLMKTTITTLKKRGILENTIIIIGSDHGKRWDSLQRIPLIFRFPQGANKGAVTVSTQNMDIAPTILDYLGQAKPDWMEGESLLKLGADQRPIFSATNQGIKQKWIESNRTAVDTSKLRPPYYQFGTITVMKCQKWYRIILNPEESTMETGDILNYASPCSEDALLTDQEAFGLMVEHLQQNGFDVSLLQDFQKISKGP